MAYAKDVPPVHLHIGDQQISEGTGGVYQHIWPVDGSV